MAITRRVGEVGGTNTKRVSGVGASSYDPWGGSWASSWGESWLAAVLSGALNEQVTRRVTAAISALNTIRVPLTASGGQTARVDGYTPMDGLAFEGDLHGTLLFEGDVSGELLLEGDMQSGSLAALFTKRIAGPV